MKKISSEIPKHLKHLAGIYEIYLKSDERKNYVGQTSRFGRREYDHNYNYNKGIFGCRRLMYAFKKYGIENFKIVLLEIVNIENLTKEEKRIKMNEREQYWMDKKKPRYNLAPTAGTNLGVKHSKNAKTRLRSQAVTQKSKNGKIIKHFSSMSEASKQTGIGYGGIRECCIGMRRFAGNHAWCFKNQKLSDFFLKGERKKTYTKVSVKSESLDLIFKNQLECAKYFDVDSRRINEVIDRGFSKKFNCEIKRIN